MTSSTPGEAEDRPLAGIGLCAAALLAFAVQDVIVKDLSDRYSAWELLSTRTAVVLVVLVPFALAMQGWRGLRSERPGLLLLRGALAFLAFSSYYLSLAVLPLADAAAMFATGPLFMTALSTVVLREHVDARRWGATGLGFVGVLIMLAPGGGLFEPAALLPLASAFVYAFIPLITRRTGGTTTAVTMAVYSAAAYLSLCLLGAGVLALVEAPAVEHPTLAFLLRPWTAPRGADLAWMLLCGAVFTVGFVLIAEAYRRASVSVVAPLEYSYIVWAGLLGYLVFGDVPSARTALGAAIIVGCGIYVARRQALLARAAAMRSAPR